MATRQKQRSLLRMQQEKLRKQRALTRTKSSSPTSQRVEKVKVKVEPQKQLKGKPTPKALPPGNKGGAIKPKVKPTGRASAKRAQAAAKQVRAAQGTKSPTVRTGQPAGSANRMYGANRVNAAVNRATKPKLKGKAGAAGLIMTAASAAGASGLLGKRVKDSMQRDEDRMDRLVKNPLKKDTTNDRLTPKKETKKTSGQKTNRRGRVTSKPSPKPAKRGMSNIPAKEGTGKGSPNDKPKNNSAPKGSAPKGSAPKASAPKASAPKPPAKKSAIHTYKAHGSDLHIGRHKTLKEHREAVAKNKKKKT